MARYIDADLLIETMQKRHDEICDTYGSHDLYTSGYDDGVDAVENAPTADVVPRAELAREIFARVRKAFYDVSFTLHNKLTDAILNDDKYTVDLIAGEDEILRAVRRIIEEFAKEYMKGGE